jgi:hypothetical protein
MKDEIDWSIINNIVDPEHQYREVKSPPLDSVRMAWPFKTEEELRILSKWFKDQEKLLKKKVIQEHIDTYGKAIV